MTAKTSKIAPPNSLILVMDPSGGMIPASMSGSLIASTGSCVAVGCRSEVDGTTKLTLGEIAEVNPGYQPFFRGDLKTPSRKLVLQTIDGQTILEIEVAQQTTNVQIWANDSNEPDQIFVGV